MTCRACTAAQDDPRTPLWERGCIGCDARTLACIGTSPDDLDTMTRMFGRDRLAEGRRHFDRWASALRQQQARQAARLTSQKPVM